MLLLQKVFISLFFLSVVRGYCLNFEDSTCISEDLGPPICTGLNTTMSLLSPVKFAVDLLSPLFGPFGIIGSYVGSAFQPSLYDFSSNQTAALNYNVIIITATTNENITLLDFIAKCQVSLLVAEYVIVGHSGWHRNCYGRNSSETLLRMTIPEWQEVARIRNATVVIFEWGAYGLSCSSYIALCECQLSAMARLIVYVIIQCKVKGEFLTFVAHSLGAHILGYATYYYHLETGEKVAIFIGSDPAGPLFDWQYTIARRCVYYGYASYSLIIHCDPWVLGTNNFYTGTTHVLSKFVSGSMQPTFSDINPGYRHPYCLTLLKKILLLNISGSFHSNCSDAFTLNNMGTQQTLSYYMLPWQKGYFVTQD
ncbi:uncharacterized protein LOC116347471 [Contarinia nasturtii]|uniref:uncharacterized protein LOC116347471 n=1 Tax=Contarinia nasturtii TaxID=265458 RepID=UPI0012D45F78|nr:uncharacterized protein LOC116347471 [Contarinia nasturtii]